MSDERLNAENARSRRLEEEREDVGALLTRALSELSDFMSQADIQSTSSNLASEKYDEAFDEIVSAAESKGNPISAVAYMALFQAGRLLGKPNSEWIRRVPSPFERIEKLLSMAFREIESNATPIDKELVPEFLYVGEPGLALDKILAICRRDNLVLSPTAYAAIVESAKSMGTSPETWSNLQVRQSKGV